MSEVWRRIRSVVLPLAVVVAASGGSGCGPRMSERTHAFYELGKPFKYRPAVPGGDYQVQWSATEDGPRTTLDGTRRTVAEGELLGFSLEEGRLMAIAGNDRFAIQPVPRNAQYFVWQTQFVREKSDPPTTRPAATPVERY